MTNNPLADAVGDLSEAQLRRLAALLHLADRSAAENETKAPACDAEAS